MSDFTKKVVDIINKVQNKKWCYTEILVNEHDDGGYETVSEFYGVSHWDL